MVTSDETGSGPYLSSVTNVLCDAGHITYYL